jgi:hypothetical protein
MKRSRFPEWQIAVAPEQAEEGTRVAEDTPRMGISEETFYPGK